MADPMNQPPMIHTSIPMRQGHPLIVEPPRTPWQVPQRHWVMVDSGYMTGIYYITIENLPLETTWQNLIAFIGEACPVDGALAVPGNVSWVRLRGQANFEAALNKLRRDPLWGQQIRFSDRNRMEPIEVITTPALVNQDYSPGQPYALGPWSSGWVQQVGDRHTNPHQPHQIQQVASLPPQPVPTNSQRSLWPVMPMVPNTSQSGLFSGTNTCPPGSNNTLAPGSLFACAGASSAGTTGIASAYTSCTPSESTARPGPRSGQVMVEMSSERTTQAEILSWIRQTCGDHCVSRSEFSQDRGYVLIHFKDFSAAVEAFGLLKENPLHGRPLNVRFVPEDVVHRRAPRSHEAQHRMNWMANHRPSNNDATQVADHGISGSSATVVSLPSSPRVADAETDGADTTKSTKRGDAGV